MRSLRLALAFLPAFVPVLATCSSDDEKEGDTTPDPVDPAVIGAEGGTVRGPNGVTIEVPEGAVSRPTTFTITEEPASNDGLPAGLEVVGSAYRLRPEGVRFQLPVRVTLPAADAAGEPAFLIRSPASGGALVPVAAVDAAGATLSGLADEFSVWKVARARLSFFDDYGCYVPEVCTLECTPDDAPTSCSGACESRRPDTRAGARCEASDDGVEILCSCDEGSGGAAPRSAGDLRLPRALLFNPRQLAFVLASQCGWPCPGADAGTGGAGGGGGAGGAGAGGTGGAGAGGVGTGGAGTGGAGTGGAGTGGAGTGGAGTGGAGTGGAGGAAPLCLAATDGTGVAARTKLVDAAITGITGGNGFVLSSANFGAELVKVDVPAGTLSTFAQGTFIGAVCVSGSTVYYEEGGTLWTRSAAGGAATAAASGIGTLGYCTATSTQVFWASAAGLHALTPPSTTPALLVPLARTSFAPQANPVIDGDEVYFATPGQPVSSVEVQVWRQNRIDDTQWPVPLIPTIGPGDSMGEEVSAVALDATDVYVATDGSIASIYRIPRAGGPAVRITITSNPIRSMLLRGPDVVFTREYLGVQSVAKNGGGDAGVPTIDLWAIGARLPLVAESSGNLYVNLGCGIYTLTPP